MKIQSVDSLLMAVVGVSKLDYTALIAYSVFINTGVRTNEICHCDLLLSR